MSSRPRRRWSIGVLGALPIMLETLLILFMMFALLLLLLLLLLLCVCVCVCVCAGVCVCVACFLFLFVYYFIYFVFSTVGNLTEIPDRDRELQRIYTRQQIQKQTKKYTKQPTTDL